MRFGTDGIRGEAGTELTPELVTALGRAAVRALGREAAFRIARDTRRSGPMLEAALVAGILAEGGDAEVLGVLPTPGLAEACRRAGAPGAMISASHNPFADNGIKLFEAGGRKLRDDTEAAVERELAALTPSGASTGASTVGARATARTGSEIGIARTVDGAVGDYVEHLVGAVAEAGPEPLAGLRVVLDCGNGAASEAAPVAMRRLGADVEVLADEPDGVNINDRCGSTDPSSLQRAVVDLDAHLGLAFDGDADRVIAVDERGGLVDGDHLLAIMALDLHARGRLPADSIVTTVMANLGLRHALAPHGITIVETPVGDRHVLAAMEEHGIALGGEQSGHLIFAAHAVTGDGPLAGVLLAEVVARAEVPLSDLAAVVTKHPQELVNVRVQDRDALDGAAGFWSEVAAVEAELGDDGRVLVRPSGTEPVVRVMVEAGDAATAQRSARRLADALVDAAGAAR